MTSSGTTVLFLLATPFLVQPATHTGDLLQAPSDFVTVLTNTGRDTLGQVARKDTLGGGQQPRDTLPIVATDPRDDRNHWLRDFDQRSSSNKLGYFLNARQIEALHPQFTSDALRRIPGVVVVPSHGIGNGVRIRGCAPLVWVDGQRAPGAELDEVTHGSDVAALEVYRSLAGVPAEFTDRSATCGTILVWMKTS